jgi:hypothetical protein
MISEEDVDKALAYLRDKAPEHAQNRADRLYLEQYIKTVLAQEQSRSGASSVVASEVEARCSEAFKLVLQNYKSAIELDETARFMRNAAEAKIEAWRTMCSNRRAEGKAYT